MKAPGNLRWLAWGASIGLAFALGWAMSPAPERLAVEANVSTTWTCSMHPAVQQPAPGRCPLCGMDLIPATVTASDLPPTQVTLSERARVLARLQTTEVVRRADAAAEVRLLGRVEPDETTRRSVTAWTSGRIDRLHLATTGEKVQKGQVIATLYSPEMMSAHQDLITAAQQAARLQDTPGVARDGAAATLRAAQERLTLLGVPAAELPTWQEASSPTNRVAIRSPFSGTIIERVASEGAYVTTGAPLYRIADLDRLWVQLDAYEGDLGRLAVGQSVRMTIEGLSGESREGTIGFIDPTLDSVRRTANVRVALDNRDGRLRPGLFVDAVVNAATDVGHANPLVVPSTAPLFTGRRAVVYVESMVDGRHVYTARDVRLGPRLTDVYPVVSGLEEGERVVSRGAFTLDADLQIRGGASMMAQTTPAVTESSVPLAVSATARAPLRPVVEGYLRIQQALANDDLPSAQEAGQHLHGALAKVSMDAPFREDWAGLSVAIGAAAHAIGAATSLEQARNAFETLSTSIERLLVLFGNPTDDSLRVAFCPMAAGSAGAAWVQAGDTVDNAYFGASMKTCGDFTAEIPPHHHLTRPPK